MLFLETILEARKARLAARRREVPEMEMRARARCARAVRDLASALSGPDLAIIAEIKRASPSKGALRSDLDPALQARTYETGGASAISVLTEETYFHGSLGDLAAVTQAVSVPVLRKDFLLEEYEVWEARAAGADAVLLIATLLEAAALARLLALVHQLGMAALVEVHDERDLEQALAARARIIGINNRDLRTFAVDLSVTERLRPLIPAGHIVVSESGVSSPQHVERLRSLGVHAALVGEALVRAEDTEFSLRRLVAAGRLT